MRVIDWLFLISLIAVVDFGIVAVFLWPVDQPKPRYVIIRQFEPAPQVSYAPVAPPVVKPPAPKRHKPKLCIKQKLTALYNELDFLWEAEVVRRRLTEPAVVDGQMRPAGYEFNDKSAGPHRRNDAGGFAYHPQFVDIPAMSVIDRIRAKALQARSIAPEAIKSFESDLDSLIAEGPKLKADQSAAVNKHTAAYKGIREQFDGLHSAMDILSNGEDPLEESSPVAPPSDETPKA